MSGSIKTTLPSPYKSDRAFDKAHFANGRVLANDARDWMERNEAAFMAIYGYVKSLQANHVNGRLRDRVSIFCMQNNIQVGDDVYTFANGIWAGIARYLVLYDPSLLYAPVKLASSDLDLFGLWRVSWMELSC